MTNPDSPGTVADMREINRHFPYNVCLKDNARRYQCCRPLMTVPYPRRAKDETGDKETVIYPLHYVYHYEL